MPYEHNVDKRHIEKSNRYAYMSTDVRKFKPVIEAFEVGARGYISSVAITNHNHSLSGATGFTKLLTIFIEREVDTVKACGATTVYGSSLPSGRHTFFWCATRDVKRTGNRLNPH